MGKYTHPHPTLGESIGTAEEAAHDSCTDVSSSKKYANARIENATISVAGCVDSPRAVRPFIGVNAERVLRAGF